MNDITPSATILPFPRRPAPPAPDTAPDPAADRLRQALAALERAVAAQKQAVGEWRGALASLHGNVQALHSSLTTYDARLGTLRTEVEAVHHTATGLERWADAALAPADHPPGHPPGQPK